jgi:TonB family protein
MAVPAVSMGLAGCYTSRINTDAPQRANATLEKTELGIAPAIQTPPSVLGRLWQDKPQYVALVGAKHVKEMRMISAAAPGYPLMPLMGHVAALVKVSFVVGLDGRVEDARILESSDSRFDSFALEAMKKFTFIPAEGVAGPERAIEVQPFNFTARK